MECLDSKSSSLRQVKSSNGLFSLTVPKTLNVMNDKFIKVCLENISFFLRFVLGACCFGYFLKNILSCPSVQLLQYNPMERLGAGVGGVDDIKSHPFFARVNWSK